MLSRWILASLAIPMLSACVGNGTGNQPQAAQAAHQQPYLGSSPGEQLQPGDLYNANKQVQQPQSQSWGWQSNQF